MAITPQNGKMTCILLYIDVTNLKKLSAVTLAIFSEMLFLRVRNMEPYTHAWLYHEELIDGVFLISEPVSTYDLH